jgi:HSP20 family protein
MWAEACDLLARAERMHRQFFRLAPSSSDEAMWEPPADVFENDSELLIVVALPGVMAEHVEVEGDAGALMVRAERPVPLGSRHAVRQLEIPYGSFERRIPLPAGSWEAASQELTHGCLVLHLRRVD